MTEPAADLSHCEKEPIHIPGGVQPHGALLVLTIPELIVVQASENAADLLGCAPDALLGRGLDTALGPEHVAVVRDSSLCERATTAPLYLFTTTVPGRPEDERFDAVAHCSEGVLVLELEPAARESIGSLPSVRQRFLREALPALQSVRSLQELCETAARQVRATIGFDRVTIYRFDEHWNGQVVAEDRAEDVEPLLGLHFPASDIPRQARDMYLQNTLRLITDVNARAAPLVPTINPATGRPLDLTQSVLRAVSPTHLEYLRNMGVGASMSIGLIHEGALWGIVACHHRSARHVAHDARAACEALGQFISLQIAAKQMAEDYEHRVRLKSLQARFVAEVSAAGDLRGGLLDPVLLEFAGAGGAALLLDGECHRLGQTPEEGEIRRLANWLARHHPGEMFHTNALPALYARAERFPDIAGGLLALSLSRVQKSYLLWFRPEVVQTLNWAGNPEKPVLRSPDGGLPSPRRSFESWKQIVRGTALPWKSWEIEAAADLRKAIIEVMLHLTELKRAEQELSAELDRQRRIAETLQISLLLKPAEDAFPGLEVAPFYEAAWQEADVGGDFFDAFALPDGRVALAVGDVTGKGLAAARRMMEAKFALRVLLSEDQNPERALFRLNNFLCRTADEAVTAYVALAFVALALVVMDPVSGEAVVGVAGAEPPLILRTGGEAQAVTAGDLPLGIEPNIPYQVVSLRLDPGDVLLQTSDGLTEARRGDKMFGYEALTELARRAAASGSAVPLSQLGQTILDDVRAFAGGPLQDDVCLLLVRRR